MFIKRILQPKKLSTFIVIGVIFALSFLTAHNVLATDLIGLGSWMYFSIQKLVASSIGIFLSLVIKAIGNLLTLAIFGLVTVAQYNDIINAPVVTTGWVVIRDLCNMFFVLILLVIAVATTLRIPTYEMKKTLPKLIIMAVLINFSRTISGLIIDLAQIVMLTFVNGFVSLGEGNIVNTLGLPDVLDIINDNSNIENVNVFNIASAYILAVIYVVVATITIGTLMIVLIYRVIMLWIYVILSPIAYLAAAFPGGSKYSSQWWNDFTRTVVFGPILAFFIWLSFSVVQGTEGKYRPFQGKTVMEKPSLGDVSTDNVSRTFQAGIGSAGRWDTMIKFIVGIGMLWGGLGIAQSMGGALGNVAGHGFVAMRRARSLTGMGADWVNRWQQRKMRLPFRDAEGKFVKGTGINFNLARTWESIRGKMDYNKRREILEGMERSQAVMESRGRIWGALAMTGVGGDAFESITTLKGIGQRIRGGKHDTKQRQKLEKKQAAQEEKKRALQKEKFEQWTQYEQAVKLGRNLDQEIANKKLSIQHKEEQIAKGRFNNINPQEIEKLKHERDELSKEQSMIESKRQEVFDRIQQSKPKQEEIVKIDSKIETIDKEISQLKDQIRSYVPIESFEARAAQQMLIDEEIRKLAYTNESEDLKRIQLDALAAGQKARADAAFQKLARNYDENEYLGDYVGRTDYVGMQALAMALQGKIDDKSLMTIKAMEKIPGDYDELIKTVKKHRNKLKKLNGGFSDHEAWDMISRASYQTRNSNHWAASGAVMVENGRYRAATEKEHANFVLHETGKISPRQIIKSFNRLAVGRHEDDTYFIDPTGIAILKKLDNQKLEDDIMREMDESLAMNLMQSPQARRELKNMVNEGKISQWLFDTIDKRAGTVSHGGLMTGFDEIKRAWKVV